MTGKALGVGQKPAQPGERWNWIRPFKGRGKPERSLKMRPSLDLEYIDKGGALLKTAQARVIGYRISGEMTGHFLMKSASGRLFLQTENPVIGTGVIRPLTTDEAIAVWNNLQRKLSATALLKDDTPLPVNQRG